MKNYLTKIIKNFFYNLRAARRFKRVAKQFIN